MNPIAYLLARLTGAEAVTTATDELEPRETQSRIWASAREAAERDRRAGCWLAARTRAQRRRCAWGPR